MPRYEVIAPGFMNKTMHRPGSKRHGYVYTDKPLKPVPSWLKLAKAETLAQKKKRHKVEADFMKSDAEKAAEDKKEIDAVMFPDGPKSSVVETL